MVNLLKIISDTSAFLISVYFSIIFYSIPLSFVLGEINYFLIIGGWALFIGSIYNYKGYNVVVEFSQLREMTALVNSAFLMLVISIIGLFIFRVRIPEFVTISSRIIFSLSLLIIPMTFRRIFSRVFSHSVKIENILLIGLGEMGKSFLDLQSTTKQTRFKIIGILDDNIKPDSIYSGCRVLGEIEKLSSVLNRNSIDRVIVAVRHLSDEKIMFIQSKTSLNEIPLNFLPSIESFSNNPVKLKDHAGIPLISKSRRSKSIFYESSKRLIDIILALISFVLSLPFWIIIPIFIKKDSVGPVLFSQQRVGKDGGVFKFYKFRSMYINTKKYAYCPTSNKDPRITKIGRWLRKTSLDELPQLVNVLKGEMSMVGPRPEMPFIVNEYNAIEKKRLIVKPGVTGLWQISLHRNVEINHNLEYDFYYIENQGFVLDLVILFMTIFFVVRGVTH